MNRKKMTITWGAAALLSAVLAGGVMAQTMPGISFPPARSIPAGTQVRVKLLMTLSSATANTGDPVRAEVVSGDPSGLPVGTILTGQVTEVRGGTVKRPGLINVQFGGPSNDLASAHLVGSKAVAQKSNDLGIGAGAGALLGLSRKRKLGDALTGAALGALGGFAVGQAQKHPASDVSLKRGAVIPIRLDRTLSLRTQINAY